jgi:hypothetical protein
LLAADNRLIQLLPVVIATQSAGTGIAPSSVLGKRHLTRLVRFDEMLHSARDLETRKA